MDHVWWHVQDKLAGYLTSINASDNPKRSFVQVFPWYMTLAPNPAFIKSSTDSYPCHDRFCKLAAHCDRQALQRLWSFIIETQGSMPVSEWGVPHRRVQCLTQYCHLLDAGI